MMGNFGRYFLVAVVAAAAALAATWLARDLTSHDKPAGAELHGFVHEELDLDPTQTARIEALEGRFATRKRELEGKLRAANGELASAIANEHQYGPRVSEAVDHAHTAMGELQKATLAHVFAMRAVMRPDQATRFDAAVAKALTEGGGE